MRVIEAGTGIVRKPPIEGAPEVELLLGEDEAAAGRLAAALITVPPGGGMPEHDHGESGALVMVQQGRIIIRSGREKRVLPMGTVAVIDIRERVSLENPDSEPASLLAVFTPAAFAGTVASWPRVDGSE